MNDQAYFKYRAEVETELARRATQPAVVRAHYELAQAYLDKVAHVDAARSQAS